MFKQKVAKNKNIKKTGCNSFINFVTFMQNKKKKEGASDQPLH